MKSLAQYERENAAATKAHNRQNRFNLAKSKTGKIIGFVITYQIGRNDVRLVRCENGYATWASKKQSGTLFKTRAACKSALRSFTGSMTIDDENITIIPVGNVERYYE